MGEFQTPFNTIVTRGIKNIYSGFPNNIPLRYTPQYPTMDQLKIREENHDLKTGVLRFSEYDETYGCLIPRAPAFRKLSQQEIEDMVQRLQKPTIASKRICNTSDKKVVEDMDVTNPKYRGARKVDAAEIPGITARLTRPTEISRIRKHQTETKLAQMTELIHYWGFVSDQHKKVIYGPDEQSKSKTEDNKKRKGNVKNGGCGLNLHTSLKVFYFPVVVHCSLVCTVCGCLCKRGNQGLTSHLKDGAGAWSDLFNLSDLGDPTRSMDIQTSIAIRVMIGNPPTTERGQHKWEFTVDQPRVGMVDLENIGCLSFHNIEFCVQIYKCRLEI